MDKAKLDDLASRDKAAKQMEQKISSLTDELNEAKETQKQAKQKADAELASTQKELEAAQKTTEDSLSKLQLMTRDAERAKASQKEAANEIILLKNRQSEMIAEFTAVSNELKNLKKTPPSQMAKLQEMTEQVANLNTENTRLEKQLAAREKTFSEVVARSEELNKAFDHAKKQLEDMKTGKSSEYTELKKQNDFIKTSPEAIKKSTESRTQVEKLSKDLGELNEQHLALIKENAAMKTTIAQNDTKMEEVVTTKKAHEIRAREALRDLNQLEQKYSDLVRKDRENEEASKMLADAQAQSDGLNDKLRSRDIEIQKLQAELIDQKTQSTAVADSLNAKLASIKEEQARVIASKDDDYAKLMKMISEQANDGSSKEEVAKLKTNLEELTSANKKLVEEKRMAIQDTLESTRKTIENLKAGQEMLKQQLTVQATANKDALAGKDDEINRLEKAIAAKGSSPEIEKENRHCRNGEPNWQRPKRLSNRRLRISNHIRRKWPRFNLK